MKRTRQRLTSPNLKTRIADIVNAQSKRSEAFTITHKVNKTLKKGEHAVLDNTVRSSCEALVAERRILKEKEGFTVFYKPYPPKDTTTMLVPEPILPLGKQKQYKYEYPLKYKMLDVLTESGTFLCVKELGTRVTEQQPEGEPAVLRSSVEEYLIKLLQDGLITKKGTGSNRMYAIAGVSDKSTKKDIIDRIFDMFAVLEDKIVTESKDDSIVKKEG
jgi:hypothetical protein